MLNHPFALSRRTTALAALAMMMQPKLMAQSAKEAGVSDRGIMLGLNLALQGGRNAYATAVAEGIKIYFDTVNAKGGINGRKIISVVMDDDNKPANSEANARTMIKDGGVFALFGAIDGGPSTAVMRVANELEVPFVGPFAGPPTLRQPYQPWVFPVRAEHKEEFRALMGYAKERGLSRIGFLHADTEVGKKHLENVQIIARELGMSVSLALPFKADSSDAQLAQMAQQIQADQPQFFFNHGSASLYEKLVRLAKGLGVKTSFAGVNSGSSQIASALGPLGEGMVFSQVVPSPWQRKSSIATEYQKAVALIKPAPALSYGGLEGFMTAKLMVMALRKAGRNLTRAGLVKALYAQEFELGGMSVVFRTGEHTGSKYVALSLVGRDGRFLQ